MHVATGNDEGEKTGGTQSQAEQPRGEERGLPTIGQNFQIAGASSPTQV